MTVASAVESCEELELVEEGHLCPERVLSGAGGANTVCLPWLEAAVS
jgi:hypothetical protein